MKKGIAVGVGATILFATAVWLIATYAGLYNVAASDAHADPVRWTLETTQHRSVAIRADDVELPERFSEEMVAEGSRHYSESCVHCHGAPGEEPAAWSRGLRPEPPRLTEHATHWSPQEIYWIAENGIKMTGMPAFGSHHGREELTAITAFVTQMPGLSADDYAAMTRGDGTAHGDVSKPD